MARLPVPGADQGDWGTILNDYLSQALKPDGTIRDNAVTANTIAPNSITNAAIASNAVNASSIVDGSITETLLSTAVQTKLNAPTSVAAWQDITGKPSVIATGATQSDARASIGAGTSSLSIGTTNNTAKAGDYAPSWAEVTSKPTVLAAGNTQADARAAIGAGTSDLTIGMTATTAKPGNYSPTKSELGLVNVDNTSDLDKPISTAAQTALNAKADLVGGVIPTAQLPAISLTSVHTVTDQGAMLSLPTAQVQPGDIAVRTDGAGTFVLTAADPSTLANWTRLNAPTDVVTSVNGHVGAIVLGKSDIGLANIDNTSDLDKPISTAAQTALNAKADLVGGVIPASQLPALALTNVVTVASQPAMLSLATSQVQPGDIAVRTDGAGTFILVASDPSVLASWTALTSPTDTVTSVNGQVGMVSLTKSDIGLANVDNTSDDTKNSAIATLTNKTLDGSSNTLQNIPQAAVTGLTAGLAAKFSRTVTTITSNITLDAEVNVDYVVFIGTGGAPILPTALGNINRYTLKNIHATACTIATTASQTVEGLTTVTLAPDASIDVLSDGTNWRII